MKDIEAMDGEIYERPDLVVFGRWEALTASSPSQSILLKAKKDYQKEADQQSPAIPAEEDS